MKISEELLKKLILRALNELADEAAHPAGITGTRRKKAAQRQRQKKKMYMLCAAAWTQRYLDFLQTVEALGGYDVYPVVPAAWEKLGVDAVLKRYSVCKEILYQTGEIPADLAHAVTVLPAVSRDVLVKTALCISDTFENAWIAAGIECGGRTVFLRSGLAKFSGKEPPAYVKQIMGYCRQVLEFGIEIKEADALAGMQFPPAKRVITAANIEHFADGGILCRQPGDIVTDLAKERAELLNIKIR